MTMPAFALKSTFVGLHTFAYTRNLVSCIKRLSMMTMPAFALKSIFVGLHTFAYTRNLVSCIKRLSMMTIKLTGFDCYC